jgi:hypothetical protein
MANLIVKDGQGAEKEIEYTGAGTTGDPLLGKTIPKLLNPDGTYSEDLAQKLAFQTNTLLTNGQTYDSTVLSLVGYTQVQTDVLSDKNGTITIDFIRDAGGTDILRTLTIPYVGGSGYKLFSAPAFTPYVRYRFTCDEVGQSDFYFDTKVMTCALSGQVLGLNDFISPSMVANLGRNLIVGQNDSGAYKNVQISGSNQLKVDVSSPKTSFDELPIAELTPVTQLTFPYNVNTDLVSVTTANDGTVTQGDNMAILQTSSTANGSANVESLTTIPFRAGQGVLTRFSALFTDNAPNDANSIQGIGIGDESDGYGFLFVGDDFAIGYRTDGVQVNTLQSTWNIDVMDGTGSASNPSGMLLDPTKGNVYQISYGSGFGNVNFSIESEETGDMVLVHVLKYGNSNTVPSIYNAVLPLRAEVTNGGDTQNYTMKVASMSGFIEGENKSTGTINAYENSKSIGGTETSIFSLQNKSTFQSKTNKINAILKSLSVVNDTNGVGTFRIWEDATLGGSPSYTDISTNTSVMAVDVAGTTRTGGKLLWAGAVGKDNGQTIDLTDLNITLRPNKTYTLTSQGGGTATMAGSLVWVEDF